MRNLLSAAKYFVVSPQILRITPGALKRGGGTQDGRTGDPIGSLELTLGGPRWALVSQIPLRPLRATPVACFGLVAHCEGAHQTRDGGKHQPKDGSLRRPR
jgi:hypothetical protein